jgi:hypothetical protein
LYLKREILIFVRSIDGLIDLDLVEYYNFGEFGVDILDEDLDLAYQTSATWDAMDTSGQEKLLNLLDK